MERHLFNSDHRLAIYKAIVESAVDGILLADLETRRFVLSNESIQRMLGYSEAELRSLGVDQIHPQESLDYVLEQFYKQAKGEIAVARDLPVKRKDGTVFYADIASAPIQSGDKSYMIGFFHDKTELMDTEADLRKTVEQLEILSNITAEISSSLNADTVFRKAVELSAQLIGGDGGSLAVYDPEKEVMRYPYHYNMPENMILSTAKPGSGLAERVMLEGSVLIADYPAHPRALKDFVDAGLKVLAAVPVSSKGRNIGALGIFGFTADKRFSMEDIKVLEAVGRQVGIAVDNARLYERTQRHVLEIKRIERDLRESEERYRSIVESVNDWIWEVDAQVRYTYASPRIKELLGYSPSEVIGKRPFDLMPPKETEAVRSKFEAIVHAKRAFSQLQNWNVHKDGHLVLMETSGVPLLDENGQLVGYRGIDRDITQRHKTQAALKNSEEKFRSIVENSFDVIITMATDGTLTYVSPSITRLGGYAPEEMVGYDCRKYFPKADVEKIRRAIERMKNKQSVEMMAIQLKKTDGALLDVEANASPIVEDDKVTGAQLIFRDVTEKKHLEKQLLQKQKIEAIGTLTAGITHDFNNILSIIIGNTELAMASVSREDRVRKRLERINAASFRARNVVRQLLQFCRNSIEDRKRISPLPLIHESLDLLKATIPGTIEVAERLPDESYHLIADATQIQQVLINLCANAIHAMSEHGGILEIRLENLILRKDALSFDPDLAPGKYVRLTVSDTGHGMDAEMMQRIFDPYYTTKALDEGTGMGLAVVHGIVKNHGGGIEVSSAPGRGATFSVYLPASENGPADAPEIAMSVQPGHERILFIDDEQMLVELARESLTKIGYQVTGFSDPMAALELFSAHPDQFDIVVTDMTMPKISGDRLALRIMSMRPELPIILCTGYNQRINAENASELGIAAYIEKPFKINTLAETIRSLLQHS